MRIPLIAGNWKMHMTRADGVRLAGEVVGALGTRADPEVALCPPATALESIGRVVVGTRILLGAQTMHWEPQGAYTGEISAPMLVDLGCRTVIVGHSERRLYCGESDEAVGRKVRAALAHGLVPIACVGESLGDRERGDADAVITRQVRAATGGAGRADVPRLVVAYEPVWAIGTGRTATGEEANRVAALIRRLLGALGGAAAAEEARILYGGSVKPENIHEFLGQTEIDGALVGGASLDAPAFVAIARAAGR